MLEPPRLAEAGLTSTHNLCFGAKIRKVSIPFYTPVFLYKNGVQGGIHYMDMFSWSLVKQRKSAGLRKIKIRHTEKVIITL